MKNTFRTKRIYLFAIIDFVALNPQNEKFVQSSFFNHRKDNAKVIVVIFEY